MLGEKWPKKVGNYCTKVKQGNEVSYFCVIVLMTAMRPAVFCALLNACGTVIAVRNLIPIRRRLFFYY